MLGGSLGVDNQLIAKDSHPYVGDVDGNVCVVNVDLYCECGYVLVMLLSLCVEDSYYCVIRLEVSFGNVLVHSYDHL